MTNEPITFTVQRIDRPTADPVHFCAVCHTIGKFKNPAIYMVSSEFPEIYHVCAGHLETFIGALDREFHIQ